MKFLAILTVVFASTGVMASEVGTQNQKAQDDSNTVKLALSEKGNTSSWSVGPLEFQATAHQTANLNKKVENMNAKVSANLDTLIAEKMAKSIAQ